MYKGISPRPKGEIKMRRFKGSSGTRRPAFLHVYCLSYNIYIYTFYVYYIYLYNIT